MLGPLIGYRKLVVGNRDWRIIWRATTDGRGKLTVEIAEVWAVGARSDGQVYAEMERRVSSLGAGGVRTSLEAVVRELGKADEGIAASPVMTAPAAPEQWLVDRLVHTAGLDRAAILAMSSEQAVDAWTEFISSRR